MEKFAVRLRWRLYSMVNVLNTIKMYTIKWLLLLCYMNFSSVKIVRKVKKEFLLPNAIVPAELLFMVGLTTLTTSSLQPLFPPGSITHNPALVWSIEKVASRPPFLSYFVFPVRRGVPSQIGGVGEKSKPLLVFFLRSSADLLSRSGLILLSVLLLILLYRGTWGPSSAFQSHLLPCQLLLASLLAIRSKCTSPFVFMLSSAGIHWPHFSGKGFSLGSMLPASSSTLKFSVFSNYHRKVTWSYLRNKKCSYWFLLHQFAF